MNSVYIYGSEGRIGKSLTTRLQSEGFTITKEAEAANAIAVCTPTKAATEILSTLQRSNQLAIDFSGAAKRLGIGSYGLLDQDNLFWSPPHVGETLFGNPGCIASAALRGLADSGLKDNLAGEIQITACGGKSYTHQAMAPSALRAGNRTIDHPHVAEVEKALTEQAGTVTHFSTLISHDIKHGLLVTVSGKLLCSAALRSSGAGTVEIENVVGTDAIQYRYQMYQKNKSTYFTLQAAIDNVEFVTSNAVQLLKHYKEA